MRRLTLTPNHSLQEQWTSCADPSATRPGDAGSILHDRTNSIDAICCAYMLLPCSALFRAQKLLHLAWLASARASAQRSRVTAFHVVSGVPFIVDRVHAACYGM